MSKPFFTGSVEALNTHHHLVDALNKAVADIQIGEGAKRGINCAMVILRSVIGANSTPNNNLDTALFSTFNREEDRNPAQIEALTQICTAVARAVANIADNREVFCFGSNPAKITVGDWGNQCLTFVEMQLHYTEQALLSGESHKGSPALQLLLNTEMPLAEQQAASR